MRNHIIIFLILFFIGCNSQTTTDEYQSLLEDDSLIYEEVPIVDPDLVEQVIGSIPAPLEMTSLIQGSGANYSNNILNPTQNIKNYNTNFKKAINLGIYGADLAYINLYEQNQDALFYLNTVKKLADDIRVGQYFNFESLKRLTTASGNLDSLLYITTSNFEDMYRYLQQQNQSSLAALILTGGWLEALHIATQIQNQYTGEDWNNELREKIGEQKITLDQLMLLLSIYKKNHNIIKLRDNLDRLKKLFEKVEVKYTYEEPTFKEIDGMLIVEDHSTSNIIINKELLAAITSETELIRSTLTE